MRWYDSKSEVSFDRSIVTWPLLDGQMDQSLTVAAFKSDLDVIIAGVEGRAPEYTSRTLTFGINVNFHSIVSP